MYQRLCCEHVSADDHSLMVSLTHLMKIDGCASCAILMATADQALRSVGSLAIGSLLLYLRLSAMWRLSYAGRPIVSS